MKGIGSVMIVYTSHYVGIKVYDRICVPDTFWGFLSGMITTGSPVCRVALKIIEHTETSYSTAFAIGATRFLLDMLN